MAVLNDLPDELLLDIFSRIYHLGRRENWLHNDPIPHKPKEIVQFTLVSRRLRSIAEAFLYHSLDITHRHHKVPVNASTVLRKFLRSILSRPVLATYVRHLRIEWEHPRFQAEENEDQMENKIFVEAAEKLGIDAKLRSELETGSAEPQVVLLLHLLPNLETLQASPGCSPDIFENFLTQAALDSKAPLSKPFPLGLRNLRHFSRDYYDTRYGPSLKGLLPFFALPCIESISGYMVTGSTAFLEKSWDLDSNPLSYPDPRLESYFKPYYGTSSVKELKFKCSNLANDILPHLLRIPKALKNFTYQEGGVLVGEDECNAKTLMCALAHTRDTLEHLDLDFSGSGGGFRTELVGMVGSLRGYPALVSLTIDADHFVEDPSTGGKRLVDMVPPALRMFSLLFYRYHDGWEFGTGLVTGCEGQLIEVVEQAPALEEVNVWASFTHHGHFIFGGRLEEACKAAGVVLIANDFY